MHVSLVHAHLLLRRNNEVVVVLLKPKITFWAASCNIVMLQVCIVNDSHFNFYYDIYKID